MHLDLRAHADQFGGVHKAVFKDFLFEGGGAFGGAEKRHHLRLKVGREAGERLGRDIDSFYMVGAAFDLETLFRLGHFDAGGVEFFAEGTDEVDAAAQQFDFAAADGGGKHVGAQFDAVGNNGMCRGAEAVDTLDGDCGGAITLNLRAHAAQAIGEIDNFGLAGGVVDDGGAFGQCCGHHDVLGGPHRGEGEVDHGTLEAATRGLGIEIAIAQVDARAHFLKSVGVDVHRTCADGTPAWQGHFGIAFTREERSEDQIGGAHFAHDVIFGAGVDCTVARHGDHAALLERGDFGTQRLQQLRHGADVAETRGVGEGQWLFAQQRGRHEREGGILCASDRD